MRFCVSVIEYDRVDGCKIEFDFLISPSSGS